MRFGGEKNMEMKLEKSKEEVEEDTDDCCGAEVVRWERFLPRMALRVLLVEADDSTRRIISALLRKCSYRVTAVSDGLQAWETIRVKPQSIDIIMTEVDLPSISGYALLTLVMEHEVCKNIPVIMMSSQDSVSTVFKYMLRGAVDFLVKPLRSNELRNLWQHVWRRQTHGGDTTCKAVASLENNAVSNYSSDLASSRQKQKECSEKEGDTQSSCTMPHVEAESAYAPNMQGFANLKSGSSSILSNTGEPEHDHSGVLEGITGENLHAIGSEFQSCNEVYFATPLRWKEKGESIQGINKGGRSGSDMHTDKEILAGGINSCDDECNELSSRAIDLIATIDFKQKCMEGVFNYEKNQSAPKLELSLRRTHPSSYTQGTDEMKSLNHSNASAFSLYTGSKTWQPPLHILSTDSHKSEDGPEPSWSKITRDECTFPRHRTSNKGNAENRVSNNSVPGIDFDNVGAGYDHAVQSSFFAQYGLSTGWNTRQTSEQWQPLFPMGVLKQPNPENESKKQVYIQSPDTMSNSMEQTEPDKNVIKPSETPTHDSPAPPRSTSSTLCNETSDHNWQEAVEMAAAKVEGLNDIGFKGPHSGSHFMTQREAALTKFRLKRKDRCYEKKVRYQSRKRLAEQWPRVKGQFVRQIKADPPITEARCS